MTFMSSFLGSEGREGLRDDITIIPVGGLDKVASFISLLRGPKLKASCLLDSFNCAKGKQRLDDMIQSKIIKENHVIFFDEFAGDDYREADIEDMFEKSELLQFSEAFPIVFQYVPETSRIRIPHTLHSGNTNVDPSAISIKPG